MDRGIARILIALLLVLFVSSRLPAQTGSGQQVYVPVISDGHMAGAPVATVAPGKRVFGLLGQLTAQQGSRYSYTLTTADGAIYGLVGESPEVEQQMAGLVRGSVLPRIKVWGEVTDGSVTPMITPVIVVSGLLAVESLPADGGVGGASVPVAVVKFDLVNLHSEPSESSSRVGAAVKNQACNIIGRTPSFTWWLLGCADGQEGWIDARLVTAQGSTTGVPIVTSAIVTEPEPIRTPTPTPQTFTGWRTAMYANPYLSGEPAVVADAPEINFNWGSQGPSPALPVDGFSLRLERTLAFSPAYYRLTVEADDGVRVWVDGEMVIDAWHGATNQPYTAGRILNGSHTLRVDYFEASGLAYLRMALEAGAGAAEWDAAYFAGTTPTGNPLAWRTEPRAQNPLDHNWGAGSPAPGVIAVDFWSARWTGDFPFEEGSYVFRVRADDGVRVWLNGQILIDQWRDGYKEVENRFIGIGRGDHTLTVEYYERSGDARVTLWWTKESDYWGPR